MAVQGEPQSAKAHLFHWNTSPLGPLNNLGMARSTEGHNRETLSVQPTPGAPDHHMSPAHEPGQLGQDPVFLAAPAWGAFGMGNG